MREKKTKVESVIKKISNLRTWHEPKRGTKKHSEARIPLSTVIFLVRTVDLWTCGATLSGR